MLLLFVFPGGQKAQEGGRGSGSSSVSHFKPDKISNAPQTSNQQRGDGPGDPEWSGDRGGCYRPSVCGGGGAPCRAAPRREAEERLLGCIHASDSPPQTLGGSIVATSSRYRK